MAKGLFTVFSDTAAVAQPTSAATSKRRGLASSGKGLSASSKALGGLTNGGGKENVDPWGVPVLLTGKQVLGKGKMTASINKAHLPSSTSTGATTKPVYRPAAGPTANTICTGTLRTRVLPELAPLSPCAPSTYDIALPPADHSSPAFSLLSLESTSTPNSAKDSGYAQSVGSARSCSDVEGGCSADFDGEEVQMAEWRREEDYTVVLESVGDKKARALTESPLAEVRPFCYSSPAPHLCSALTRIRTTRTGHSSIYLKTARRLPSAQLAVASLLFRSSRTVPQPQPTKDGPHALLTEQDARRGESASRQALRSVLDHSDDEEGSTSAVGCRPAELGTSFLSESCSLSPLRGISAKADKSLARPRSRSDAETHASPRYDYCTPPISAFDFHPAHHFSDFTRICFSPSSLARPAQLAPKVP